MIAPILKMLIEWVIFSATQCPGGRCGPAFGPQALRVTGWAGSWSVPYPAGPKTLAEFIVPTIK